MVRWNKKISSHELAFDNYDELTSTLSGAQTVHDTMGILYQNIGELELVVTDGAASTEKKLKEENGD